MRTASDIKQRHREFSVDDITFDLSKIADDCLQSGDTHSQRLAELLIVLVGRLPVAPGGE